MKTRPLTRRFFVLVVLCLIAASAGSFETFADDETAAEAPIQQADPADVLTPAQWDEVKESVDRALEFLSSNQLDDGSFRAPDNCQPAVTSLCVMAMLSAGNLPGEGKYGRQMEKAIDFVLSTQSPSGFFSLVKAEPYIEIDLRPWPQTLQHGLYNHAIASLMLTEVFGMTQGERNAMIKTAINRALATSRKYQVSHKASPDDIGGWRYMFRNFRMDSDLSVSSWQLLFYRSAKNVGFEIPDAYMEDGMAYVKRCFDPERKLFRYCVHRRDLRYTRAMNGVGILALSLGGEHGTDMAKHAGDWLLEQSFTEYNSHGGNRTANARDQYHYSVFYSTLGMFQLGGKYWTRFYPPVVKTLLANQRDTGAWDMELHADESRPGHCYTTSLMIMALSVTNQVLPIYQR